MNNPWGHHPPPQYYHPSYFPHLSNGQPNVPYAYAPYGQQYHHNAIRPSYSNSTIWHGGDGWHQPGAHHRQHLHPYAYHNALQPIYPQHQPVFGPNSLNRGYEEHVPVPVRLQRIARKEQKAQKAREETADWGAIPERLGLRVESEVSARKIVVKWTLLSNVRTNVSYYQITATCIAVSNGANEENIGRTWTFEQPWTQTQRELKTTPGNTYTIRIECRDRANAVIASNTTDIRACFDTAENDTLYVRAVKFAGSKMHPFEFLYRCKPKQYWDFIHHNGGGVMMKYLKDDNGQPANQINGRISGLFFSARLLADGSLPQSSPFGDVRMMIHSNVLLNPLKNNFYFADFYCNYLTHYVTIVVCLKGSETDRFCEDKRLICMDMMKNPFLTIIFDGTNPYQPYRCWVSRKVWVEVYFTEDIPLSWGKFSPINAKGAGTSKIGGLPNNKECETCNLYPQKKEAPPAVVVAAEKAAEEPSTEEEKADEADEPPPVKKPREEEEQELDYDEAFDLTIAEAIENSTLATLLGEECRGFEEQWEEVVETICGLVDSVCEAEEGKGEEEEKDPPEDVKLSVEEALVAAFVAIPDENADFKKVVEALEDYASAMNKQLGEVGKRVAAAERRKLRRKKLPPSDDNSNLDDYLEDGEIGILPDNSTDPL